MQLANEAGGLMFALSLHLNPFNSVACLVILHAFLSYADFLNLFFFKSYFQEYHQSIRQFGSRSGGSNLKVFVNVIS